MHVDIVNNVPLKIWADEVEESAMQQLCNVAMLPFLYKHVAVMPDVHAGFGVPIGTVVATTDVVIPNLVGVDIGCGVSLSELYINGNPLNVSSFSVEDLRTIRNKIFEVVPVGKNWRKTKYNINFDFSAAGGYIMFEQNKEEAAYQVGTLGGGNHFIELQQDSVGQLYVMVHSGSRNVGKKVGDYYNSVAKKINKEWYSSVSPEWDLAFLSNDSKEGNSYWMDMNFCRAFATINRKVILESVCKVFSNFIDKNIEQTIIDTCHNFADIEHHFGRDVIVHRKGAVRVRDGLGLIPGSQGSRSFIVKGKNEPMSFCSSSHGAGRLMGRKVARNNLDLQEEISVLDSQGIIHSMDCADDLDEATGAYKNIFDVMSQQSDLVDIVTELKPVFVIKAKK